MNRLRADEAGTFFVAYILFTVAAPEASELHNRKLTTALVGIIVFINVLNYCVGAYNCAFLTCGDFELAGASPPANCWKGGAQN